MIVNLVDDNERNKNVKYVRENENYKVSGGGSTCQKRTCSTIMGISRSGKWGKLKGRRDYIL